MALWKRITAHFGAQTDMLGFPAAATPTADEWLAAFTANFLYHPNVAQGTAALMSGLRYFTPEFTAQIAALPPVAGRLPVIPGNIPQAIYTATGPIIAEVYQTMIGTKADRRAIQAAFARAVPALVTRYNTASYTVSGLGH